MSDRVASLDFEDEEEEEAQRAGRAGKAGGGGRGGGAIGEEARGGEAGREAGAVERVIGNLLPNIQRQRCTCYALCHILYPVSAALTSIFRMDCDSTSYGAVEASQDATRPVGSGSCARRGEARGGEAGRQAGEVEALQGAKGGGGGAVAGGEMKAVEGADSCSGPVGGITSAIRLTPLPALAPTRTQGVAGD